MIPYLITRNSIALLLPVVHSVQDIHVQPQLRLDVNCLYLPSNSSCHFSFVMYVVPGDSIIFSSSHRTSNGKQNL